MWWLLLFLILLIGFFLFFNKKKYHIVCANYNKDVNFLKLLKFPYTIVDKTMAPNIANEATSYLWFILNNWDNLPENMIFIHDHNESWHQDGQFTDNINTYIKDFENSGSKYYNFNKCGDGSRLYSSEKMDEFHNRFWKECMQETFGDIEDSQSTCNKCCAQFIVNKQNVKNKPKEFYQNLYDWMIDNTNDKNNNFHNPKHLDDRTNSVSMGQTLEWTWSHIFQN